MTSPKAVNSGQTEPASEAHKDAERAAFIDVVFDGSPSRESGRFVEVEDATGRSINAGEWIDRGNGLWALRIGRAASPQAPAVIEQWQFRVKDVGSPMWTNITHSDANELKDNPAFELRALSLVPPQAPAVDGAEGPSLGVLKATHEGFSFVPHPNATVIPYEGMSVYAAPLTREAATVPLTERQIVAAWVTRFNYVEDRNAPNAEQIGFYRALLSASSAAESKTLPRASEQADEAVTDGVAHFNWLCSLMPEGFHWGEPLTPDVLDHIASAARAKDSK